MSAMQSLSRNLSRKRSPNSVPGMLVREADVLDAARAESGCELSPRKHRRAEPYRPRTCDLPVTLSRPSLRGTEFPMMRSVVIVAFEISLQPNGLDARGWHSADGIVIDRKDTMQRQVLAWKIKKRLCLGSMVCIRGVLAPRGLAWEFSIKNTGLPRKDKLPPPLRATFLRRRAEDRMSANAILLPAQLIFRSAVQIRRSRIGIRRDATFSERRNRRAELESRTSHRARSSNENPRSLASVHITGSADRKTRNPTQAAENFPGKAASSLADRANGRSPPYRYSISQPPHNLSQFSRLRIGGAIYSCVARSEIFSAKRCR